MQWLRALVRRSPKTAMAAGKALFLAGAILVLGAVFARAGLVAVNTDRAAAKLPPFTALAQAYPDHPTWIVPETPVGFTVSALLVLAGMALVVVATDVQKRGGPGRR